MNTSVPLRTNTTALLAVFAGVLGFCFWGIGGVLAIVLGLAARGEIARSAGREGGNAAAIVGIVLGGLNVASCVIGVAVAIAMLARPSPPGAALGAPGPAVPAPPAVLPSAPKPHASAETSTRERAQRETLIGSVRVVDAPAHEVRPLRRVLEDQQRSADAANERLLLFVVGTDCLPCNGVMLALEDARMQSALRHVRIIRVNAAEFSAELGVMGIPVETVPGFALLAAGQRVSDYVDGGEWDADIAQNIAPVLAAFLQGKYRVRRRTFRGEEREDETSL